MKKDPKNQVSLVSRYADVIKSTFFMNLGGVNIEDQSADCIRYMKGKCISCHQDGIQNCPFLSPPMLMHGGLLCIIFSLSVKLLDQI